MGVYDKKRPKPMIWTHWFALWPQRGKHMPFWAAVSQRVSERRIKKHEHEKVRRVCAEVEALFAQQEATIPSRSSACTPTRATAGLATSTRKERNE